MLVSDVSPGHHPGVTDRRTVSDRLLVGPGRRSLSVSEGVLVAVLFVDFCGSTPFPRLWRSEGRSGVSPHGPSRRSGFGELPPPPTVLFP